MHFLGPKFSSITRFLAIFALIATVSSIADDAWNSSALAQTISRGGFGS